LSKIALIGNSHSIAIRSAIEEDPALYSNVICFNAFTQTFERRNDPQGQDPRIAFKSIRGDVESVIRLADFELFVVSAGGWWAARNPHLQGRGPNHPLAQVARPEWAHGSTKLPRTPKTWVSLAAFNETVRGWVSQQAISQLLRFLCIECGRKVVLQPWPAPSRIVKRDPKWLMNAWYGRNGPRAWRDFFVAQRLALRQLVAELAGNATLLEYPRKGILLDGFMDESLCSDTDPFHGNVAYGRLVLKQLEPLLH
jgi:hypothetical protein